LNENNEIEQSIKIISSKSSLSMKTNNECSLENGLKFLSKLNTFTIDNQMKTNTFTIANQGDSIIVVSSPFGALSPLTFTNHLVNGSICNCIENSNRTKTFIYLTDASVYPGSEGAPVFLMKQKEFVGVSILFFNITFFNNCLLIN
jgi:hypothetical protein